MFVYHHIETEIPELHAELFTSSYWHSQHAITGTSRWEKQSVFCKGPPPSELSGQEWVLRHYYRGGVPGKVLADQVLVCLDCGSHALFGEYQLLMWMNEQGLPVPVPVCRSCCARRFVFIARIYLLSVSQTPLIWVVFC